MQPGRAHPCQLLALAFQVLLAHAVQQHVAVRVPLHHGHRCMLWRDQVAIAPGATFGR